MLVTQWVRHYWGEDDTLSYFEIGDDGWAVRQVALRGADQRPLTAATSDEVLRIRDHGDLTEMQAYERKYGVLAEGDISRWDEDQQVVEITKAEFEQVWLLAREALDQHP